MFPLDEHGPSNAWHRGVNRNIGWAVFTDERIGKRFPNSAVGVATDLAFALLPIPMLYKVQVNWKIKAIVCFILGLGLL